MRSPSLIVLSHKKSMATRGKEIQDKKTNAALLFRSQMARELASTHVQCTANLLKAACQKFARSHTPRMQIQTNDV